MSTVKQLNLTSRQAKQRELAVQLRLMARLEATFIPKYRALLVLNARAASKAYISNGKRGAVATANTLKKGLKPVLIANITASMTTFGRHTLSQFRKGKKATEDVFNDAIQAYLKEHGLDKIDQIAETTRDNILAIIAAGEAEGLAIHEIAANIVEQAGGTIARVRAHTIAITETHSAATFASDAAAESTGLTLTRVWMAADDARTRPTHIDADGQRRSMTKPFTVGGASLDRPGDPNGPARETVRCRCVVLYEEP